MKLNKITTQICLGAALTFVTQTASAYPIEAFSVEDPRCDPLPQMELTHELGDAPVFPLDELLESASSQVNQTVCVTDDGIANDYIVIITNKSGRAWKDLMFVADEGNFIGNSDGFVIDGASGSSTDAFLIDPFGINANLLFESLTPDVIFEPGETWEFLVSNFMAPGGPTPFDSLGIGGSSGFIFPPSTASIIANPVVPVPAAAFLFGSGLLGMFAFARRSRKS